jgi:membrane associated rhomboid family serine protease
MERNRAVNLHPVVTWLAVALVTIHAVRDFLDPASEEWALLTFAFIPARYGPEGVLLPGGGGALFWTPITYAFLHADWVHLFVNIIWMASFGGALARRFGTWRFTVLSLVSAVAGVVLHFLLHHEDRSLVIGASAAVSGMMAATARFAFSPGGPLSGSGSENAFRVPAEPLFWVLKNGRAVAFILIWFGVNFVFGLVGGFAPGFSGPIAWEAHVGGFLAGLLCFPLLDPVPGKGLVSRPPAS